MHPAEFLVMCSGKPTIFFERLSPRFFERNSPWPDLDPDPLGQGAGTTPKPQNHPSCQEHKEVTSSVPQYVESAVQKCKFAKRFNLTEMSEFLSYPVIAT